MQGVYNVKEAPYNATGDGTTNDIAAFKSALDAAYANGGGIVLVPPGTYKLADSTDTLPLPLYPKVYIKGMGGLDFGYMQYSPDSYRTPDYPANWRLTISTRLLLGTSGKTMFQVPVTGTGGNTSHFLYQAGMENIILDSGTTSTPPTYNSSERGIDLPDFSGSNNDSSRALFRNVIIFGFAGTGFYAGLNHHELSLDGVIVLNCGGNGVEIHGRDTKLFRVESGNNRGSGFFLQNGGAIRGHDLDAWGNHEHGFDISDTLNLQFFGLTSAANQKTGLYIHPGSANPPYDIQIFRGNFAQNSVSGDRSYADVELSEGGGMGAPVQILFEGCQFKGNSSSPRPSYAIKVTDSGSPRRRNIVADCKFFSSNYGDGTTGSYIINDTQAYKFRDCFDESRGFDGLFAENSPKYRYTSSDGDISPFDVFVLVGAAGGMRTLTLPKLAQTQLGTTFYVSKGDATANNVRVAPYSGENINGGTTPVSLTQLYQSMMIVNAGSQWNATKFGP